MSPLPVLLIAEKTDLELEAVADAWRQRGGEVRRPGKYWIIQEDLRDRPLAFYGSLTFSLVLAQLYHRTMVTADDTLLARLDRRWTKRAVALTEAGSLTPEDFPLFVKPVLAKSFTAGVFENLHTFKNASGNLPADEPVLTAPILNIQAEARAFVLHGRVLDLALYEGQADLDTASDFIGDFLSHQTSALPETCVVDLAYCADTGWMILEFNSSWGAGLNGCNAALVVDAIVAATLPPI